MMKSAYLIILACLHQALNAQDASHLQEKLTAYSLNTLQEKVFIHLDKSSYIAGEICWFKIYNVDASLHRPLDINKVAYVEIINNRNIPVLQTKVALTNGLGNGSLNLPASLPTGNYTLRGYTNWMKNFPAEFFFEKPILIVNALKMPDTAQVPSPVQAASVRFFPEGGQLVAGVPSKIAFRMADMNDRGIDCNGVLLNENSDTIISFNSLKFGIGTFHFTPAPGMKYKAVVQSSHGKYIVTEQLPVVRDKGYVLSIDGSAPQHISVDVLAAGTDEQWGDITLLVHARQLVQHFSTTAIRNGRAAFTINTLALPEGISHFTLFRKGLPVAERMYFTRPVQTERLQIIPGQRAYNERSKVELSIEALSNETPIIANMSLSVFRTDSLQEAGIDNFKTYLLLADLRGRLDSANYYFSNQGDEVNEALDNVMLTHGWTRFNWDDVLSASSPSLPFAHEHSGHIITGKITDAGSGIPQRDIVLYLSTPSRNVKLSGASSNGKGEFQFITRDFFGRNEIIVQAPSGGQANFRIDINTPFSEKPASQKMPLVVLPPSQEQSLLSGSIGMQVQQLFYDKEYRKYVMPETDTSSFYGTPDESFLLDDYTRFTTIEEILREFVPQVNVRKQNGKFRLQMYDGENKTLNYDPLVLLDGVPMFDVDRFMTTLDPLKLSRLDVIPNTYFLGPIRADGITSFISYNGDMAEFEPDPGSLVVDYEGMQLHREFYSPDYSLPELLNSRLPDFRNVLYWQAQLNTDETGQAAVNFYTSNQPGNYRIVVHGITKDGKAISGVSEFTVKSNR